jgi:hypothetical protein
MLSGFARLWAADDFRLGRRIISGFAQRMLSGFARLWAAVDFGLARRLISGLRGG